VKVLASAFNCRGPYSDTDDCPELVYLNPTFDDFQNAFKTPSLRGVAGTAPYMHTGAFPDLESVLAFYSELPGEPLGGHRELTLRPLKLSEDERGALLALLSRFSDGQLPPEWLKPEDLTGRDGGRPIPKG
jgi:cytochrome c peroxidase